MALLLRIILTALGLICTNLIFYGFQPGGRYLILLEAILAGLFAHAIYSFTRNGLDNRLRSLLGAAGIFVSLGLIQLAFSGIKLSIPGLILVYLGLVGVERGIIQLKVEKLKVKS